MKKRYNIRYAWTYDMVVEIDHSVLTDEKLHEINNFWSDADFRLQQAKGNILHAVLKMLAMTAFRMTITDLDAHGELEGGTVEGWPPMNGMHGITLVLLDDFELDEDEITIKEQE